MPEGRAHNSGNEGLRCAGVQAVSVSTSSLESKLCTIEVTGPAGLNPRLPKLGRCKLTPACPRSVSALEALPNRSVH